MSDLPVSLSPASSSILLGALDQERKIERALEALGPIAGRDLVLVGGGPLEIRRHAEAGARVTAVESLLDDDAQALPDASADVIVSAWSAFRDVAAEELAAADRLLRAAGRLLVVHDYGRDDVSRLLGDLPEYGSWSRKNGPFLGNGFRVRVIHCFWTFDTIEATQSFLADAFGEAGVTIGAELKRPRLSWNVAIYHRSRGGLTPAEADPDETEGRTP